MIISLLAMLTACTTNTTDVYRFDESSLNDWNIINDGVMGGKSKGNFSIIENNIAQFSGFVSLENNGGFTMVSNNRIDWDVNPSQSIQIRLKGDGNNYQFRVRADDGTYYSYVHEFTTSGEWEVIEIPLNEMYASWRGMKQDIPDFNENKIEEIAFLIGNKKAQEFNLLIESLEVN